MRTAVAVDGQGRAWIFYSAQRSGNFDLYARSARADGSMSSEIRLTSDPGTDIFPVAATDATGRVWVAWQGFRNNNLEILTAAQNGDTFTPESDRFRIAGQRLGPGDRRGAQRRSGDLLGYLRQRRLRRLPPPRAIYRPDRPWTTPSRWQRR